MPEQRCSTIRVNLAVDLLGLGNVSCTGMYDYWKLFSQGLSLERFMAAVENQSQPPGPPNTSEAIKLAHDQVLQSLVPFGDVASVAWQLAGHFDSGSTHDLALVTGLYFLQARAVPEPRLNAVRMDARLLAQQWMTEGYAAVALVSRFEESLHEQFP